jgi:hypothetical protein
VPTPNHTVPPIRCDNAFRCGQGLATHRRTTDTTGMSGLLDGKVVLINGGMQGVGGRPPRAAVREGAQVVVAGAGWMQVSGLPPT